MSAPVASVRANVKLRARASDSRARLVESAVQLRKDKRDEGVAKRRHAFAQSVADADCSLHTHSGTHSGTHSDSGAELARCLAALASPDPAQWSAGVVGVRTLLARDPSEDALDEGLVDAALAAGVLPRLVAVLQAPAAPAALLVDATWALTNIASTARTLAVVNSGALPALSALLVHADADVRDHSLWCLGNVAGDSREARTRVFATPGAVQGIFANVSQPASLPLLRNATWALSNLCRQPFYYGEATHPFLVALTHLVSHEDAQVVSSAAWGLGHIAVLRAIAASGALPRLVALLSRSSEQRIVCPALRVTGNFIAGDVAATQAALDVGALRLLVPLLAHSSRRLQKEALWTLSNVAAGSPEQMAALVREPGLLAGVVRQLQGGEWTIKKEAVWLVANIASPGERAGGMSGEHVRLFLDGGVLGALIAVMASFVSTLSGGQQDSSQRHIAAMALDAVAAALRAAQHAQHTSPALLGDCQLGLTEAGLEEPLEALCEHDDARIRKQARLVHVYVFGPRSEEEEEEDEEQEDDEDEDAW